MTHNAPIFVWFCFFSFFLNSFVVSFPFFLNSFVVSFPFFLNSFSTVPLAEADLKKFICSKSKVDFLIIEEWRIHGTIANFKDYCNMKEGFVEG